MRRDLVLAVVTLLSLALLAFILPTYHQGNFARIMVLAVFAMGYNFLFGYAGLLSLGHALFFAAGLYGFGLSADAFGLVPALMLGVVAALLVTTLVGGLALRTRGVAFMIVTLMFAQAGYLTLLYFGAITGGDEGFVVSKEVRSLFLSDDARYWAAFGLFACALLAKLALVNSWLGQLWVAVRENEARTSLLGYNTSAIKFSAVLLSGLYAGLAGAAYAALFGYVGASFATVQYSILPLLWVLVGGVSTVLGPFVGTLAMFYLIDLAGDYTDAHMLVAGIALLIVVLFARRGLMGLVK